MAGPSEPVETVQALLPNGIPVTVSAEQARQCRYRILSDEAPPDDVDTDRPSAATVRAWALASDVDCPEKGRIPDRVFEAYRHAHQQ